MRSLTVPRSTFLLCSLVMLCSATSHAGAASHAYNLLWNDCSLGAWSMDLADACDSDVGPAHRLIVSFVPGELVEGIVGVEGVIEMVVDGLTLPDWWRLDASGCRRSNLTMDWSVGVATPPYVCTNAWYSGGAVPFGGVNYVPFSGGSPNRGRIQFALAVPSEQSVTFDPAISTEWYLAAIDILRDRTTQCAGCDVPACLTFNTGYRLARDFGDPRGDVLVTMPAFSRHVTWQGGGAINCPGATPVRDATWGQIKEMYR